MAEYDLVIRGGTIVDGTGIPRYQADLAVKNGRIAKISGKISAGGAKEIDASGAIVAPGAIDLHTHYDAQVQWDPYCSLSGWFGVTSLTIGQCGFGFAPTKPEDRDLNMRMMNRIEAIPLDSMKKGLRWDWETFPEFLDSLDKQGLGVNIGALFPFSPMRGYIMGMLPARERTSATEAELNKMREMLHEAMTVGAFGFSANQSSEDKCEDGAPIPSHVASREEFIAMAEVLGEFGVGHIGWTMGFDDGATMPRADQNVLLPEMVRISGRPLHVNLQLLNDDMDISWLDEAHAEGLPILSQETCLTTGSQFTLAEYNLFDVLPSWIDPLVGTPEQRIAKLSDLSRRPQMKSDVERMGVARTDWNVARVEQVVHERNYQYEGMTIAQLAEATGKHPVDAFLDLALDEDLQTEFSHKLGKEIEEETRARILEPYGHVSNSDGGAHVRFQSLSTWPVYFLYHWVRDKEIMSLEQAHYKMSALPAWFADFKDRGSLRVGSWADVIVYDQDELGMVPERPIYANDFPGGERRLIQKSSGLRYTIVNGGVTFEGAECTGSLPGKLLRSYDAVS